MSHPQAAQATAEDIPDLPSALEAFGLQAHSLAPSTLAQKVRAAGWSSSSTEAHKTLRGAYERAFGRLGLPVGGCMALSAQDLAALLFAAAGKAGLSEPQTLALLQPPEAGHQNQPPASHNEDVEREHREASDAEAVFLDAEETYEPPVAPHGTKRTKAKAPVVEDKIDKLEQKVAELTQRLARHTPRPAYARPAPSQDEAAMDALLDDEDDDEETVAEPHVGFKNITATVALDPAAWGTIIHKGDFAASQRVHDYLIRFFDDIKNPQQARPRPNPKRDSQREGQRGADNKRQSLPAITKFIAEDMLSAIKHNLDLVAEIPQITACSSFVLGNKQLLKRLVMMLRLARGMPARHCLEFGKAVDSQQDPGWITDATAQASKIIKLTNTGRDF